MVNEFVKSTCLPFFYAYIMAVWCYNNLMIEQIEFKKLTADAILPTRETSHAAALDLYANEQVVISSKKFTAVKTGVAVAVPSGHYGRIAPRSGLAVKFGIDTLAGVIDSDYRGELIVLLMNNGDTDFTVNKGDRIAQFLIEAIITPEPVWAEQLTETDRGEKGFGSTGGFTQ
jgi:dUTP pyrophosphatase